MIWCHTKTKTWERKLDLEQQRWFSLCCVWWKCNFQCLESTNTETVCVCVCVCVCVSVWRRRASPSWMRWDWTRASTTCWPWSVSTRPKLTAALWVSSTHSWLCVCVCVCVWLCVRDNDCLNTCRLPGSRIDPFDRLTVCVFTQKQSTSLRQTRADV